MSNYQPTLGVKETAANIGGFIRENKSTLWNIVKPLAPWLIGLYALDIFLTYFIFPDSQNGFVLGGIFSGYFYAALAISWHRVMIEGPENAVPMNPFKPKKHELMFMLMGIALGLGTFIFVFAFGLIAIFIHPVIGFFTICMLGIIAIYVGYRVCFYFPGKAVNHPITLRKAFDLTPGYLWKLMGTSIVASFKYLIGLVLFLILIIAVVVGVSFVMGKGSEGSLIHAILELLFSIPVLIYFYPLLYAVGVSTLSNYYLYALQNKNVAQ